MRTSMSRPTNLYNIVQNPDERVAILETGHHASFLINSGRKTTYFRNIWDLCHLDLIVSAVVRVVWKGYCTSNSSVLEEDVLCLEVGRHASFLHQLT